MNNLIEKISVFLGYMTIIASLVLYTIMLVKVLYENFYFLLFKKRRSQKSTESKESSK